jgi:hypothetical protein
MNTQLGEKTAERESRVEEKRFAGSMKKKTRKECQVTKE